MTRAGEPGPALRPWRPGLCPPTFRRTGATSGHPNGKMGKGSSGDIGERRQHSVHPLRICNLAR